MSLINVSTRLDRDTHRKLRILCFEKNTNLGELIKRLLMSWMQDQDRERKGVEK
jgi:hypothetical protein